MTDAPRPSRSRLRLVAAGLVVAAVTALALATVLDRPAGSPSRAQVAGPPPLEDGDVREVTSDVPDAAPPALAFTATGLAGGGFQNVVAFSPDGAVALAGGDNAGLHRSTDAGLTWLPVGAGLPEWAGKVAAIAFDPDDPEVVVAAGGFSGSTGGVLRSDDGGRSWEVASEAVRFSGANTPDVDGLPRTHPRATGNLLQWLGGVLFAATFDDGVHRSVDGGRTWEQLGLSGPFLRGMTPVDDGTALLVGTSGEGLWRIDDPAGDAAVRRLEGGPTTVEEVALDGEDVLVAAGDDGIWRLRGDWERVHVVDAVVTTVAVDRAGQWWAGTHSPAGNAGGILRSADAGATWEVVDAGVTPVIAGTRLPWWVAAAQGSFLPGNRGWTAAQFASDPSDPATVLLAGRAGLWRTSDGGATWAAAVAGLGATAHDETVVAADGRIATANTDHRLLVSDDLLRTVTAIEPGATKGTAVAADPTQPDGTLLVATAERDDNTDGELYRVAAGGRGYTALGLGEATGGRRVMAVGAGLDEAGGAIVLAAVEEAGLWRLRDGTWSRVPTDAFGAPQGSPDAGLVWPAGSTIVHALDRTSGLWRSEDAGATWDLVLDAPVPADRTDPAGFLDAGVDGSVWVTTANRVLQVTAPGRPPVAADGIDRPGPVVALDDGAAVVVTRDDIGLLPRLLHVCGTTVTEVATGARFRGGATDATDLDLDDDGHLVVTTATNGLLRSASPVVALLPCDVAPTP